MKHKKLIQAIFNKFLEGDRQDSEVNTLIRKVNAVQGGSEKDAADFANYTKSKYGINDDKSFVSVIKSLLKGIALVGVSAFIVKSVASAVAGAYMFIQKLPIEVVQNTMTGTVYFGGHGWWGIGCIVACFITFVLYKVFMWLLKKPDNSVTESMNRYGVKLYKQLELKKSLLETEIMFLKLNNIVSKYNLTESDVNNSAVNSVIEKAQPQCQSMLSKITTATSEFIQKHKNLIIAILICIGLVIGGRYVYKLHTNPEWQKALGDVEKLKSAGNAAPYGALKVTPDSPFMKKIY